MFTSTQKQVTVGGIDIVGLADGALLREGADVSSGTTNLVISSPPNSPPCPIISPEEEVTLYPPFP